MVPQQPHPESGLQGTVKSWNGAKGFGFITCEQVNGDVFFSRNELPPEAREVRGTFLEGRVVSFEAHEGPDGRAKASNVQILNVGSMPLAGMIKSYSEQNRYGFLTSSSLSDDVRFQSTDLPPMTSGAYLKGKLVTFEVNQLPDGKLRVSKMMFQTNKIAQEVNAYGGGYGGFQQQAQRLALPAPAPAAANHQQDKNGGTHTGTVKSFSERHGYGFINTPGQAQDIKFGKADLLVETVASGTSVSFVMAVSPDGRMQARQVQPAGAKRAGGSFGTTGMTYGAPPQKQARTGPWVSPTAVAATELAQGLVHSGTVKSYIPSKGFGFITCPEVPGDVYFMRQVLPQEAQDSELKGQAVSFVLAFAPDGKHRASSVTML